MQYKGVLSEIREKHGNSARGPWTLYTLVLNTDNGEQSIGVGFDKPKVMPGTVITVEATENARGYLEGNSKSIQVLKGEEAAKVNSSQLASGVASLSRKERSIVTQAAFKVSPAVLANMIETGVMKIPAKNGYEVYMKTLFEVTKDIFDQCLVGFDAPEEGGKPAPNALTADTPEEGSYDPLS